MNFNENFLGAEEAQHPHPTVTADGAFQRRYTVRVTAALECSPAMSQAARGVEGEHPGAVYAGGSNAIHHVKFKE